MSKTILITGASTGFGRDTAETLNPAGHTVFASMRDPQAKNREHAQALRKQGIEVVELDVSSDASVDRAVKEVLARAGRIDVLVKTPVSHRRGSPRHSRQSRPRWFSIRTSLGCSARSAR